MSSVHRFALVLLLAASAVAQAQQVYRIVGPDGKVTFSDRPAASDADRAAGGRATVVDSQSNGAGINTALLPYELREVTQRYPVTIYTSQGCAPCNDARALLRGRGVPFVEKTVSSAEDADALNRLTGGATVPYATIGSQALKGFSSTEWTQYLDLAGYPKQTALPASFRMPPASPMVATAPVRPASAPAAAARQAPAPADRPPANPAGIQF